MKAVHLNKKWIKKKRKKKRKMPTFYFVKTEISDEVFLEVLPACFEDAVCRCTSVLERLYNKMGVFVEECKV